MTTKQVGVNVKEARLIDQWLHTSIASVTWRDLINFFGNDMKTIAKVVEKLDESELYAKVGADIEAKAHELVDTKCKPEWDKISEEMKPIGEKRNVLAKEKAEAPTSDQWPKEKEDELQALDKQLSDLSNSYQKITDEANKELNEFKEQRINEEQGAAFLLNEEDYKLIGGYCGF